MECQSSTMPQTICQEYLLANFLYEYRKLLHATAKSDVDVVQPLLLLYSKWLLNQQEIFHCFKIVNTSNLSSGTSILDCTFVLKREKKDGLQHLSHLINRYITAEISWLAGLSCSRLRMGSWTVRSCRDCVRYVMCWARVECIYVF